MATPTTTIATKTIPFGSCAAESDTAHPLRFAALYRAYRSCRRGKRGTRKARRYETRLLDHLANTAQALQSNTWRPSRAIRGLARVPAHKQLLNAPPETGLPIGNLASQFFANVYLNELDQFIKHTLKVRHYLRYVDDFVLLHDDPAQLEAWRTAIADFLHERLGLALRDKGKLAPIGNGIDFLGYIVRADYLLARRRVVGHMDDRLARHRCRLTRGDGRLCCPPPRADAVQATLASYFGHFRHARTAKLRERAFVRHPWLFHLLRPLSDGRLMRVDSPARVSSLASQWRYFRQRYPGHVLLMQVGNRWECDVGAVVASPARPGLPPTLAIPPGRLPTLKRTLTRQGRPWCEVAENGWLKGGMKRR